MPYRLKFDHPNAGEGAEMLVTGLGTFENGKTYEVSDDAAQKFSVAQTVDPENPVTLDSANIFGVTVTKVEGVTTTAPVDSETQGEGN